MKSALRITGIFLTQLILLLFGTRLFGSPIRSATIWRVPFGACSRDFDLDFRFMIGLTAASFLVAMYLYFRRYRQSTLWSFVAALALLDFCYGAHLKFPAPCM